MLPLIRHGMCCPSSENFPPLFVALHLIAVDCVEDGTCRPPGRRLMHAARQDPAGHNIKIWPPTFLVRILLSKIDEHIYVGV